MKVYIQNIQNNLGCVIELIQESHVLKIEVLVLHDMANVSLLKCFILLLV